MNFNDFPRNISGLLGDEVEIVPSLEPYFGLINSENIPSVLTC